MDNARETAGSLIKAVLIQILVYLRALLYTPVYWWRSIFLKLAAWRWLAKSAVFRGVVFQYFFRYLFVNPFTICRLYFMGNRDDTVQTIYGETPLSTFQTIAELADVKEGECVYELGCGRGIGVFWLHLFRQCRCVGIEVNPVFVRKAREVKASARLDGVEFLKENFLDSNLSDADVIYLYGSALEDSAIKKLVRHFKQLRPGTRIVTVSYPLSEYTDKQQFIMKKEVEGRFLWGNTSLYLQVKA